MSVATDFGNLPSYGTKIYLPLSVYNSLAEEAVAAKLSVGQVIAIHEVTRQRFLSPLRLHLELYKAIEAALQRARKEVQKKAVKILSLELRCRRLGEEIIRWHVGSYLSCAETYEALYEVVRKHDDIYRAMIGKSPRTYDQIWDDAAPLLLDLVTATKRRYRLTPHIPPGDFVSLF